MSSFKNYQTLGPAIYPMVAKDKGSMGNRANCAGAQVLNNMSNVAQSTITATGGAVAYSLVNKATQGKNYAWNNYINKFLESGAKELKKGIKSLGFQNIAQNGKLTKSELLKTIREYGKVKGSLIAKFENFALKGFKGAEKLLAKLAKTTGKQKALTAVVLTTLAP